MKQLHLIPETEVEMTRRELQELRSHVNQLRKSWFAKLSEEKRKSDNLHHELETLKQAICRSQNNDFANLPLFTEIS